MIRFLHYITTCGRSYYPCAKATGAMASLTLPMAPPKLMLMLLLSLVRGDMRGGHPEPDKSKTCWYPNGQQASNHYPCSSQLPGVCCSVNSVCMSNGLCLNADFTSYTEGTCTNSTWEVSTCPDFCSKGKRLSTPRIRSRLMQLGDWKYLESQPHVVDFCGDGNDGNGNQVETWCCNKPGDSDCCNKDFAKHALDPESAVALILYTTFESPYAKPWADFCKNQSILCIGIEC